MEDWGYSKHYVDSAIREAYSILKSWKRNYLKGKSEEKPFIKKRFVRVKGTLYSYREGKIKISVRPYEEYLVFDISRAWFSRRVRGAGRAHTKGRVPNDDLQVQRKRRKNHWEDSVGLQFEELGWLQSEAGMDQLQPKASKKPSLKRVLAKYSRRERDRAKDFVHKLTTFLSREYRGYVRGFEDLRKERCSVNRESITEKLRRAIGKSYSLLCHISRGS
ncbi:MAG: hypothetical protein QXO55_01905 [Candidatus Korarchaeum sp.]